MNDNNVGGNDVDYSRYNNANGGLNNGSSDFENQFRNMVVMPVPVTQQTNPAGQMNPIEEPRKDKNKALLIVMATLAGIGLVGVIICVILYIGILVEERENAEEEAVLAEGNQDDAALYQDLTFSENNSEIPLLVYAAVKNGEVVSADWLEEFRSVSVRYVEKYGGKAVPSSALFNNVTISEAESGLYPYMPLRRFLLESSEGCAKFDFYEDLLILAEYEFSSLSCDKAEWKKITSNVKDED